MDIGNVVGRVTEKAFGVCVCVFCESKIIFGRYCKKVKTLGDYPGVDIVQYLTVSRRAASAACSLENITRKQVCETGEAAGGD